MDHSTRGEPATGGVVVWDLKSVAGSRWGSVMSVYDVLVYELEGTW